MKKFILTVVACSMTAFLFTGCNKSQPIPAPDDVELKLSVASTEMAPGDKLQFTVSSETTPLEDIVINVTSDQPDIAEVPASVTLKAGDRAASGYITAFMEGKVIIKISAANNIKISTGEVKITVKEGAVQPGKPQVSISSKFGEVAPGAKIPFEIKSASTAEIDAVINIVSSNTAVAAVPASVTLKKGDSVINGEIAGVVSGRAIITISSETASINIAFIEVEVKEGAATSPIFSISAGNEVAEGSKILFTVSTPVAPEKDITVTVVSSNPAVAAVSSPVILKAGERSVEGDITGISQGEAFISIKAGSLQIGTGSVNIAVVEGSTAIG